MTPEAPGSSPEPSFNLTAGDPLLIEDQSGDPEAVRQDRTGFNEMMPPPPGESGVVSSRSLFTWGAVSIVFLGVLGFGTIPAWRYHWDPIAYVLNVDRSRETFTHIWSYQIEHLPSLGSEFLVQVVFSLAVIAFLVGVVAGLWLLIVPAQNQETSDVS